MTIIEATNEAQAWMSASNKIMREGNKCGDIIEILNGIIKISNFTEFDSDFDVKFRKVFGNERIDYASSVTFIEPTVNDNIMSDSEFSFSLCKPSWKDSYWGRMTNYDGNVNQIETVLKILREGKNVKRCELIVYSPYDLKNMYKQPCLLSIDLKPRDKKLYMTANFRSQRVSKSGYADYNALLKLGRWLCSQSSMTLEEITIIAHSLHIHASGDENKKTKELLSTLC